MADPTADPFASPSIVQPKATNVLAVGDQANAKAAAASAPGKLSLAQFATEIKKRKPEFKDIPDDVVAREVLKRQPEWLELIQTSSPRPKQTRDRTPTTEQRTQKFLENHPLIREGALALASGSGIPESDTPVSDTFKGLWKTVSDPPQTNDEKAVSAFITLPAYRIAKGAVQQAYGFGQEAFDAVDWQEVAKHPGSFDVFKASKEPAMMPDPNDPKKPPVLNPKAGQSQPGTGKEAEFVHGLVGLSTAIYTALKGGQKAKEVPSAVKAGAEKISSGLTDAVQRAAGTDAHTLTEDVTTKAKEANAADNVKIGERNTATAEKHATAVEKVTDHNAATEEAFKTKVERINQDFGEKVAKARDEHAGDVKARDQKISELHQQHIDAIKQARKEWVEKTHAAKTAEGTKESVENRKEVLQHTQRAYVDRIKENVAQTYNTVKGKLDARYENMRKRPAAIINEDTGETSEVAVKELPLDSTKLKEAVDKGRKTLQGAPADLKVFNDLVRQMEQGDGSMVDAPDGAEPTLRPLTWDEGRTHFSALGDKLYSGELPGNVAKAIKEVRTTLDGELESSMVKGVTVKEGQGAGAAAKREYGQLKKDWSTFEDDWRDVGSEGKGASPLAKLRLAVDRGVIAANVLSKNFGDRLIETLAKYKDSGANPSLLDETRKYNREAQSGSVNVSHFPGTTESVPSRVSVPKAPGKLELPEAPKEPAPVPSPEPKVAAIEAEQGKRVERATQDKPEPKPVPEAPTPEAAKPLPTIDEMVADVKDAKTRKAKKFASDAYKPTRHDMIMVSMLGASLYAEGGAGHLGYALTYLPIRYGWAKFFRSEMGMRAMTRITPADVKVMTDILDKVPEERPEAQKAITEALIDSVKPPKGTEFVGTETYPVTFEFVDDVMGKKERLTARPKDVFKDPRSGKIIDPKSGREVRPVSRSLPVPLSTFSKLLDKAQIGAILRVIAPPQPTPGAEQQTARP